MKNKLKILNKFFKFHLIFVKKKTNVSYYFKKTNGLDKNRHDLLKNEKGFKKLKPRNFVLIKQKFNLKIEQERKNFEFHQNLIIDKRIRNFIYKTILLKFNQLNFFLRSEVFSFIKRNLLISTFNFNCKLLKQRFLTEFFKNAINFLGKYFGEKKILFEIIKSSLKNSKKIRIQKNKCIDKKFLFSKKSYSFGIKKIKIIDIKDHFSMVGLYINFHNSTLNICKTLKDSSRFQTPKKFFRIDFFEKETIFMNRNIILNYLTINFPKFRYFFFQKVIFLK